MSFRRVGDDPGEGRLSRAGWSVENDGRHPIRLDGSTEQFPLTQNVILPHELVERSGTHAIGERGSLTSRLFGLGVEEVGHFEK
jgi:hypothetical protein